MLRRMQETRGWKAIRMSLEFSRVGRGCRALASPFERMSSLHGVTALILLGAIAQSTQAEAPAVQGPESVADWRASAARFMAEGDALSPIETPARNIILFVGDGMGITTLTAARILEGQLQGKPGEENLLSFERFPYLALARTYSWDQQTPDSAPTMSAMMTGVKTREGMIGVSHETARGECRAARLAETTLPTLLEIAAARGKHTGIVTTTRLTHATPANNYAHTPMRDWEADIHLPKACEVKDIARQLIEVSPEVRKSLRVALGGGRSHFLPGPAAGSDEADPEYPKQFGVRADGRNLTQEWLSTRGVGARYVWNRQQFDAVAPAGDVWLLGLFEPSHLQYEADRARDPAGEPSLTQMTEKAITLLAHGPKGYFLQVEAGRIDHAHHAGNAQRALLDTVELSRAVAKAVALTDASDTLIIVTADHSHAFTLAGYPHRGNPILGVVRDVPDVDGAPAKPTRAADGLPYPTLGYANGPGALRGERVALGDADTTALEYLQPAAVPLEQETHGGEDVAVYARGPWAHRFRGNMEQHWIFHLMQRAFGF
jgi:alkaline phosphatase